MTKRQQTLVQRIKIIFNAMRNFFQVNPKHVIPVRDGSEPNRMEVKNLPDCFPCQWILYIPCTE